MLQREFAEFIFFSMETLPFTSQSQTAEHFRRSVREEQVVNILARMKLDQIIDEKLIFHAQTSPSVTFDNSIMGTHAARNHIYPPVSR